MMQDEKTTIWLQELLFWGAWLTLNVLLFLPEYWPNRLEATFWPDAASAETLFVWRENADLFRLSLDWVWLTFLGALLMRLRRFAAPLGRFLIPFGYVLILVYAIYAGVMRGLYQVDPVFYSQLGFIWDGLGVLQANLQLPPVVVAGAVAGAVAAIAMVVWLLRTVIRKGEQLGRVSLGLLAMLAVGTAFHATLHASLLDGPKAVIASQASQIGHNIAQSVAMQREVASFDADAPQRVYAYSGYDLRQRPNIYLIFVESYGSVLTKREHFAPEYAAMLETAEAALAADGWQMATTMSESPTWGGGSWMSYTTALFGLRIESHPQYLSLVDQYQTDPYPDLGRYLQRQGYKYVQISSLSTRLDEEEGSRNAQFFGMDRWIKYEDLDFVGPHYGWGPAPPDQYVLNYAAEQLRGQAEPYLFFYVTQNSHYPWVPLPEFVDDWRTLNEPRPAPRMPGRSLSLTVKRNNYLAAVQYQLDVLVDFISRVPESEDAIFVLLGDHQPQQVSRRADGFETPLHIISRDPAFMAPFEAQGFARGMTSPQNEILLGHEGLYSLLLHALIDAYGDGARLPPPVLLRGLSG